MFNKKDVMELKRRISKDKATFTRVSGCYVDANKNQITRLNEMFLNLPDEEYFKYLDIAKKVLSGTVMDNLLEIPFPLKEETEDNGKQRALLALRDSRLQNEDMLDAFYENIIDSYDYVGNYLILVFHDAYDVITKTLDNQKLDESEEVFEYLLCAICPVKLSKEGLGYIEDENDIGARIRDWVVDVPQTGFIFPTFSERSTDIHSMMFYTKDTKAPHSELIDCGFGCNPVKTSTEKRNLLLKMIKDVLDEEDEDSVVGDFESSLNALYEQNEDVQQTSLINLDEKLLKDILYEIGLLDEQITEIMKNFKEDLGDNECYIHEFIEKKVIAQNIVRQEKKVLMEQIATLQSRLNGTEDGKNGIYINFADTDSSKVVRQEINGVKYICVPVKDDTLVNVNGTEME